VLDDLSRRGDQALVARDARIHDLEGELARLRTFEYPVREMTREISALYPGLVSLGVGREDAVGDDAPGAPPRLVVVASWRTLPTGQEEKRLRSFCARRLGVESLRLVNVKER
jgi:hypothetical protein